MDKITKERIPVPKDDHEWVDKEPTEFKDYQYTCTKCGLVIFRRKFCLGGGWGISCASKYDEYHSHKDFPYKPPKHLWYLYIPTCEEYLKFGKIISKIL